MDSRPQNQFCDREEDRTFEASFSEIPTPVMRPARRSRRKDGADGPITKYFKKVNPGGGAEENVKDMKVWIQN